MNSGKQISIAWYAVIGLYHGGIGMALFLFYPQQYC